MPALPTGGVHCHLAEVVQRRGPAQAVDLGVGEPERSRELVDVAGHTDRVPVGVRVSLVHDVGEGLQGMQRLLARAPDARMRLVHGERDGHDREHVPRVTEREEREGRPEPRLGRGGAKSGWSTSPLPISWSRPRETRR